MSKTNPSTSCYIHIPFCEHICFYCNFNKVFLKGQPVDEYIQGLLKEIQLTLSIHPTENTETVYIGGGTPTSLSAKQLDDLLSGITQLLPVETTKEFTIEANPGDLTQEKLDVIKNYGINRLSMGVQTFDDRLLRKIGRKHTAKDVYQSLKLIEKNQIENVSIDLIYALPGQSFEDFRISLKKAIALDLPHYAIYSLILENKTMFMNWVRRGRIELPEQEEEAKMFELAIEEMEKAEFTHYEISNFAKKGWESKHNLVYWNNEHYYGFGAGASGYLNQQRYRNFGPIQHYLNPLRGNQLPIVETEKLTSKNQIEEEMFLGLRKQEGVSLARFKEKFGQELTELYRQVLPDLFVKQLLTYENNRIKLTKKGLFLGNDVFEKFLLS